MSGHAADNLGFAPRIKAQFNKFIASLKMGFAGHCFENLSKRFLIVSRKRKNYASDFLIRLHHGLLDINLF